jgi:hypothetical protein
LELSQNKPIGEETLFSETLEEISNRIKSKIPEFKLLKQNEAVLKCKELVSSKTT